ncbi:MAG: hypothetical protein LLG13_04630 [Bacteroidales bacterium]|nr:hypothetical protein [Bacteroidales bacterium]
MKKTTLLLASFLFTVLFTELASAEEFCRTKNHNMTSPDQKSIQTSVASEASIEITRAIDVAKQTHPFPDLVAYRNTSLQKAPAPVIAEVSDKAYGRSKVTRCWLNLDEMWDYRTREYNFNFQIGVDKYRDIKEKHRESWPWEVESNVHFYDYMKAFNDYSDEIMLTIRRYEREILDNTLPVTMGDWKMIFKEGLKHYKILYPKIRYVEVCNEYELKGFAGATDEQYYLFYKLGYEAVNEINKELGLSGDKRLLVGGPVSTNSFLSRIDHFFEFYNKDQSPEKKLDFVSWHEYHVKISETVNREKDIKDLLSKHGLSTDIPMFISEHDPYHFSEDKLEYHFANAAGLVKSLYYSSIYSPDIMIMPWVLYHNSKLQTRFMWFDGPNEPDTKANEIRMLPTGASMQFLTMLKGQEIQVNNSIDNEDIVLASAQKSKVVIEAINYADPRAVNLTIQNLGKVFPEVKNGKLHVVKYLIDSNHSNCLTNPEYKGGIEKIEDSWVKTKKGQIELKQEKLEKNGLVLWELTSKK